MYKYIYTHTYTHTLSFVYLVLYNGRNIYSFNTVLCKVITAYMIKAFLSKKTIPQYSLF